MRTIFYVLSRSADGVMEYVAREGERVPHDKLTLSVYRTEDKSKPVNPKTNKFPKIWFVVEEMCGLACGKGPTKKDAIADALDNLQKIPEKQMEKTIMESVKKFGGSPMYRVSFLRYGVGETSR